MINKTFSSHKFLTKYAPEMSASTSEALQKLNTYFGGKNLIRTIRNRFAFHVEESEIDNAYNIATDEFAVNEYLSPRYAGHNLFGSAETLCMNAIVGGTKYNLQAITSFVLEIIKIADVMGTFFAGFMRLILRKYIDLSTEKISDAAFNIEDGPAADTVRLPFFCLPPSRPV
jgi:hypothetical protein